MSEFFDKVFIAPQLDDPEEHSQLVFEDRVVKAIFQYMGNPVPGHVLSKDSKRATGDIKLSFRWFHQAFPGFPVWLGAQKLPYVHKITGAMLFGSGFRKLPMVEELHEFVSTEGVDLDTDPAGLVFQWPKAQGTTLMVLHTWPPELSIDDPAMRGDYDTKIIRRYGRPSVVYTIEALKNLVLAMPDDWITFSELTQ